MSILKSWGFRSELNTGHSYHAFTHFNTVSRTISRFILNASVKTVVFMVKSFHQKY
jgi:hypothetical protein